MRCPKCGFHSFDYLDNCKKCGVDLTKQKLHCKFPGYVTPAPVASTPVPPTAAPTPLPAFALPEVAAVPELAEAEEEAIDFGFDVLEEEAADPLADFDAAVDAEEDAVPGFAASDRDLATDSGLSLDQPFAAESENLPDDDLPKLDDRFGF